MYTNNLTDAPERIVRRNLWPLIGKLYPGSLVSHRTAIEFQPSPQAVVYLTVGSRRIVRWPGVDLNFTDGPDPQADDNPIAGQLFVSSLERACLENLLPTRKRDRALPQSRIEVRLVQLLHSRARKDLTNCATAPGNWPINLVGRPPSTAWILS